MCENHMHAAALRHFYAYHFAENRTLWDTYVVQLSYEQFIQPANYAHGSVRNQIVHLISVDDVWFSELRGGEPLEPPPPTESDDRDVIRAYWDAVEARMRDYLATLHNEALFTTALSCCASCMIWACRQRRKITYSTSMIIRCPIQRCADLSFLSFSRNIRVFS